MTLLAKPVVKNKCWIVEDNGNKVATILANEHGVTLVQNEKREKFASLKVLSDKHNIIVDKTKPTKTNKESYDVYGYPCEHNAQNVLWDVQKKLPIFTKGLKSKSFFCAGYYLIRFNFGWAKSYCPKLITLNRYDYRGPFKTKEEMLEQLKIANEELNGIATKSTSENV